MKTRLDLAQFLNNQGLTGYGVEIGVASGDFSFPFLDIWKGTLYQVDAWKQLPPEQYTDGCNLPDEQQEEKYSLVLNKSKEYHGRSIPIRALSKDAVKQFDDNFFDFIYIDANHKYEFVMEDLELWFPKLKKLGVFAGHDYMNDNSAAGIYGVKSAVDDFCRNHKLQLQIIDEPWATWYVYCNS